VIDVRRLAAVDLVYLGPRVILAEFALGVVGPLGIGVFTLLRATSGRGVLLAAYFLCLAGNYVPLLHAAIALVRSGTAERTIADESGDRQAMFRKYRSQSLWLLVPLAVPLSMLMRSRKA
jgi:hypothetical protein